MTASASFTHRQLEILTAALQIIASEGTAALTMKRVAQEIGFTEAAMYRHFASKREMLIALYTFVRHELLAALSPVLALEQPPSARLAVFVSRTLAFLRDHKGVNLILLAETIQQHDDPELRRAMAAIFRGFKALVETLLQAGMASGHFRADIDPDLCATCLAGMIQGAITRAFLSGYDPELFDLDKAAIAIGDCFLHGITPSLPEA